MQLLCLILMFAVLFIPENDPVRKAEKKIRREVRRREYEVRQVIRHTERRMLIAAQIAYWDSRARAEESSWRKWKS